MAERSGGALIPVSAHEPERIEPEEAEQQDGHRQVRPGRGEQEGDEPDDVRKITYGELLHKVSQIANALKAKGVQKGDVVTIYMYVFIDVFGSSLYLVVVCCCCVLEFDQGKRSNPNCSLHVFFGKCLEFGGFFNVFLDDVYDHDDATFRFS